MTRQEAIEALTSKDVHNSYIMLEALDMAVEALEQELKVGHWILAEEQNKEDVENDNYRFICSECQCSDIHAKGTKVPYCWKCGAKMESEGE